MIKLSTLAVRNIKRNFKRYVMYFFSLCFSVFTAYTFFALMENELVSNVFTYDDRYRALLLAFGIIIMVFVMFFLISSNNSFIKARKKEISTYSLFGMTNRKIGRLLFMETMIVGLTALALGIGIGIFFSKLIAMVLLDISLTSDR
jgi:putative ABC transport system permease protein